MIPTEHEARVFLDSQQATLISGEITADRGWTPHVQATLELSKHGTLGSASTVVLELTRRFGDIQFCRDLTDEWCGVGRTLATLTAEVCGVGRTLATLTAETVTATAWSTPVRAGNGRTLTLGIQRTRETRDTITYELASAEADVQDIVWYESTTPFALGGEAVPLVVQASTPGELVRAIESNLRRVHSAYSWGNRILDRSVPTAITPLEHTVQVGSPAFGAAEPLLTTARQRIYSPGDGTLQVVDIPHSLGGTITVDDATNTLLDWETNEERHKETLVRFTGTASNPAARPLYTENTFPELSPPLEVYVDAPHPPTVFNGLVSGVTNPAFPYFDRIGVDKSTLKLVAVADFSSMPGSDITYTLPGESPANTIIDAITWRLDGAWDMDIWV